MGTLNMQPVRTLNRRKSSGFTLLEIMVTLTIVAILANIAWSAYRNQLNKGRRADAVASLTSVRQALISFKSDNGVYPVDQVTAMNFLTSAGGVGYRPGAANTPATNCRAERGFQSLAGSVANSVRSCEWYWDIAVSAITPTSFTLTATTGPGHVDAECLNLTLTDLDVRGFTPTPQGAIDNIPISRCWAQ